MFLEVILGTSLDHLLSYLALLRSQEVGLEVVDLEDPFFLYRCNSARHGTCQTSLFTNANALQTVNLCILIGFCTIPVSYRSPVSCFSYAGAAGISCRALVDS